MSQKAEKASHTEKLNQVQYFGLTSCRLWRNVTKARKIGFLKIASFEWGRHSRKVCRWRKYAVCGLLFLLSSLEIKEEYHKIDNPVCEICGAEMKELPPEKAYQFAV